jgi:hypothetical protein
LVFEKNASFCRKLPKIAENCDHNIDPGAAKKSEFESMHSVCQSRISFTPVQGDQMIS